jgi:hypothetical protein
MRKKIETSYIIIEQVVKLMYLMEKDVLSIYLPLSPGLDPNFASIPLKIKNQKNSSQRLSKKFLSGGKSLIIQKYLRGKQFVYSEVPQSTPKNNLKSISWVHPC